MNYLSSFCYAYFFSGLQFVCKCFHIPDIWNGKLTALTPDHMIRICVFFLSLGLVKTMGLKLSSSVFYQAICHCYWRLWTNFFVSFWSIQAALFLLSLSVNCQIMLNNATFNVSKKLIWLFNIYWVVANITIYYKYQIGMFGFCCGPFDVQHPL